MSNDFNFLVVTIIYMCYTYDLELSFSLLDNNNIQILLNFIFMIIFIVVSDIIACERLSN